MTPPSIEVSATDQSKLRLEGFDMHRADRKGKRGGGEVIYVKETLMLSTNNNVNIEAFEDCVWCNIQTTDEKILVGVCFRSPNSTEVNNLKLRKLFERAVEVSSCDRVLIMGDFNHRELDYNNYMVKADTNSEAYKFFMMTQDLSSST